MSNSAQTVRASHLLIKHTQSRNPVSRRTGQQITLGKDAAREELLAVRARLAALPADQLAQAFAEAAAARSDCGSFRNGGDLGEFGRGAMQQAFEEGTYGIAVGTMGDVVDSDSGLHIIYRTA